MRLEPFFGAVGIFSVVRVSRRASRAGHVCFVLAPSLSLLYVPILPSRLKQTIYSQLIVLSFAVNKTLDFMWCYGDANGGGKIGELRIKPSSILWKAKGARRYHSIPLDDFADWIRANGKEVDK